MQKSKPKMPDSILIHVIFQIQTPYRLLCAECILSIIKTSLLSLKKRGSEKRKFYKSYLDLGVLFRKPSVSGGAGIRE